ncbi:hypothetical protein NA63_2122 [Flavobacteriaceae bacterium MAR_2010_105]|nr:hypothetical protein NA63_2122 [Flavobacteriaceae bacterium MAR_2010_105]
MKQILLLVTGLLIGITTVNAQHARKGKDFKSGHYRLAEPISFVERGVEFLIFPDGSFDFNTNIDDSYYNANTFYRTKGNRENSVNFTFGSPGSISRVHYSSRRDRGVLITHDRDGKVRRIGNVFINYDRIGRITRAGSVYMNYQRGNGNLRQVGGLRVNYNHWGEIVHVSGIVNHSNAHMNYITDNRQWDDHYYFDDRDHDDSDMYYYYRKGKDVKKQKRIKRK